LLRHIVKQKFQNQCAAKAATFDFELGKTCGGVNVLDVFNADEAGILLGVGKAVAFLCAWGTADVILAVFAQVFAAYVFVTVLAILATEPATFIAKKFHFALLNVA